MPETLYSEATIHLFGRAMSDLSLRPRGDADAAGDGDADRVEVRECEDVGPIQGTLGRGGRTIARIYAFAFQNEYVELASPALFVLRDNGQPIDDGLDLTGLSRIPEELNEDLTVWRVEREDLTVRLDVMTGSFNRVLLDYELADEGLQGFVRGGGTLGTPTAVNSRARRRPRGWRSDDD